MRYFSAGCHTLLERCAVRAVFQIATRAPPKLSIFIYYARSGSEFENEFKTFRQQPLMRINATSLSPARHTSLVTTHTSSYTSAMQHIAPNLLIRVCMPLFTSFELCRVDGSVGCDDERARYRSPVFCMPLFTNSVALTAALDAMTSAQVSK
jgi:hypothetical protein